MGLAMFAGFPIALLIMFGTARIGAPVGHTAFTGKGQSGRKAARISVWDAHYQILQYAGDNFEKLKKACTDYRDACIKVEGGIGPLNLVAAAFLRSGLSLMTVVGVFLVTGGTLTVPDFALFLLVGTRVFDPLAVAIMNYSRTDDVRYVRGTDLYFM